MIRHSKILLAGLFVTFCLSALVIFPASAGPGTDTNSVSDPDQLLVHCLVLLEEQGIDVTEIQAVFESGDTDAIHILVEELQDEGLIGTGEEHDPGSGDGECGRDQTGERKRNEQIEGHISILEEWGVDVAEIRAAFERGDMDAVRTFFTELQEDFPAGNDQCQRFTEYPDINSEDLLE